MIVSNQQVSSVLNAYNLTANKAGVAYADTVRAGRQPVNDALSLSAVSKMQSVAYHALQKVSDTRADKVGPLKAQMVSGTVRVTPEQIAQKMLDRLLIDEFI
jgi:anti-sigma28 factor (negative regulator of flagellin synthesis)